MDTSALTDISRQIDCIQEALAVSNSLKEKIMKLESEKNKALEKCNELMAKIERLDKEGCSYCSILTNQLMKVRKEKEMLKKEEKAKLLRTIAKTLESMEDVNTNPMTNAQQLFTQLVCGGFDSPKKKGRKNIVLIRENDDAEEVACSGVLVNETESAESSNDCNPHFKLPADIVIPESQSETAAISERQLIRDRSNKNQSDAKSSRQLISHLYKENKMSSDHGEKTQPINKKLKLSPTLLTTNTKNVSPTSHHSPQQPLEENIDKTLVNNRPSRSPSVFSEMEEQSAFDNVRSNGLKSAQEVQDTAWKMKRSVLVDANVNASTGKKLKQMTLSVTRANKKLDISLSEEFKGGVIRNHMNQNDDEKDLILPSPEHLSGKNFCKKSELAESMEDPDLTIFNPVITSTCLPVESSFDRLPEPEKSPPYKYRRDTVRKRTDRMKLPGQDCDQCVKYYEAAGLDKTQDLRTRMNKCSRHRDKYQIRANTPPGFWDPVLPVTPEKSQES